MFNALYRESCREGSAVHPNVDCKSVLNHFIHAFAGLAPMATAAAARRKNSREFYRQWAGLRSTRVCFLCMCQRAEHVMPCRHTICDNCVVIFGITSSSAEYHTDLSQCPICGNRFTLTFRRLPPTKGPVILSLDGGGVRGMIQLGLLQAMENRLDGISITEVPDYCIGTSIGV